MPQRFSVVLSDEIYERVTRLCVEHDSKLFGDLLALHAAPIEAFDAREDLYDLIGLYVALARGDELHADGLYSRLKASLLAASDAKTEAES